ncbi:CpcT/CpeT family chromophore lyase [Nostoc flagelliforme]|uniref:CpcT/CpeT family chromophore lyase n=2 Tax=Nostoc flagelliforme TaxID=1306274 RepID=UPI001CED367A
MNLDKGMDIETHEQIWRPTSGPLRFEKRENFADDLCAVSALCRFSLNLLNLKCYLHKLKKKCAAGFAVAT